MTWEIRKLREAVLAREVGAVRKEWGGKLRVALVYPNRYAAGMSNLGFLSVHARINARRDALCERAFLPGPDERRLLAKRGRPAGTLESGRPLSDFDIVAFSLSYENDLPNVPAILSAGGVAPFREARAAGPAPLVLAGGFAASLNPEPAGTVADAVVAGDGERAVEAILDLGEPRPRDPAYLAELASVPGVFVPAGYRPVFREGPPPGRGAARLARIEPLPGFPPRVVREAVPPGEIPPIPTVLAEESELGAMALVETSRGCPRMCGFCASAHACPAFREFPLEAVTAAVEASWPHRRKIGLVGAAVLDWSHFRALSREVLRRGGTVSPASVRADLVDDEIAGILAASGHRTVALAPEAGDEALRRRIGKPVTDARFASAGRTLAGAGIVSFKLYFMVGLPGARRADEVEGIAGFIRDFRGAVLEKGKEVGRMGTVTAVLSPFVPKPFTPLQWAPMAPEAEIRLRQERVAAAVRPVANVRVSAERPRAAALQAYLGLSDRRVRDALAKPGGATPSRPDGGGAPSLDDTVFREKDPGECFPWDVIDGGLPRAALRARYESIVGR